MKECSRCGDTRDETEFYKGRGRLRSECKRCTNLLNRQWRKEHPDKVAAYNQRYRESFDDETWHAMHRAYWRRAKERKLGLHAPRNRERLETPYGVLRVPL